MQNLIQIVMQKWGRTAVRQATNRHALLLTTSAMLTMLLVGCGGSSSDDSTAAPAEETTVVSSDNFPASVEATHTATTGDITSMTFSLQYGGVIENTSETDAVVMLAYTDATNSHVLILSAEFDDIVDPFNIPLDEHERMLLEGTITLPNPKELLLTFSDGSQTLGLNTAWLSKAEVEALFADDGGDGGGDNGGDNGGDGDIVFAGRHECSADEDHIFTPPPYTPVSQDNVGWKYYQIGNLTATAVTLSVITGNQDALDLDLNLYYYTSSELASAGDSDDSSGTVDEDLFNFSHESITMTGDDLFRENYVLGVNAYDVPVDIGDITIQFEFTNMICIGDG